MSNRADNVEGLLAYYPRATTIGTARTFRTRATCTHRRHEAGTTKRWPLGCQSTAASSLSKTQPCETDPRTPPQSSLSRSRFMMGAALGVIVVFASGSRHHTFFVRQHLPESLIKKCRPFSYYMELFDIIFKICVKFSS